MSLDKIVDDIALHLKTALTELRTSELVGGRVDLGELQRRSKKLPAAFVTCVQTRRGSLQYGKLVTTATFVVVLAVQSRVEGQPTPQDRAHGILQLLTRTLLTIASAKTWGNDEVVSVPQDISSDNPYNKGADANGVALWGITWQQDLELVAIPEPADLPDLTSIHVDWSMVESTQPEDAEDDTDTDGP